MPPTWPNIDMTAASGATDPRRVRNLFTPAGMGLTIHNTIRTAQLGSCIGVLLGLTQSFKVHHVGIYASHGGRIGGVVGMSLLFGKTVIDESMSSFEIEEQTRKLRENKDDEKMTLTTLTCSMLGAGAAYSGRKMGALEGGFLGIAGGTALYFVSKYMKSVIDREVQKGRKSRSHKQHQQ